MNIDWDRIEGVKVREAPAEDPSMECTPEEVQAALDKIEALPALADDPDQVATFWPVENKWRMSDLDFRDVTVTEVTLSELYASNGDLSREKLEEHVEHPGESTGSGPFDAYPIVFQSKKKQTIIDGQHRLAALMLLGAVTWPVYLVPK